MLVCPEEIFRPACCNTDSCHQCYDPDMQKGWQAEGMALHEVSSGGRNR